VLIGQAKHGTLAEKHVALKDIPGPESGPVGVLEKIESFLMDANRINKRELAKRTPFFSRDQRDHIVEEVKAEWALRKSHKAGDYQVVSYIREGKQNVALQYSFRNLKTGRFEKPKEEEKK
jgi:hypothetical protein